MMKIDLAEAVKEREREIARIVALEPKLKRLISDAENCERGQPCMPESEWRKLQKEVEDEMWELGLIRQAQVMGYVTIVIGKPSHWVHAEVIPPPKTIPSVRATRQRRSGRKEPGT